MPFRQCVYKCFMTAHKVSNFCFSVYFRPLKKQAKGLQLPSPYAGVFVSGHYTIVIYTSKVFAKSEPVTCIYFFMSISHFATVYSFLPDIK